MPHSLNDFIHKLRASDDRIKKRWLYGASAASMTIILLLWLAYVDLSVQGVEQGRADNSNTNQASFWLTMRRGTAIVSTNFLSFLGKKFSEEKKIDIKQPENVFVMPGLPEIPPQKIQ